ncbi:MAG: hypothetical protein ACFCU4_07115 [Puniceicoccaceae bacterium]
MKNFRYFVIQGLLLLILSPFASADELLHTIESADGRSLQAKVLSVGENSIKIERSDGFRFDIRMENLSEETQKRMVELAKQRSLMDEKTWGIVITRKRSNRERTKSAAFTTTTLSEAYEISVTNNSNIRLDEVSIRWHLYVEYDSFDPRKGESEFDKRGSHRADFLEPGVPLVFETETINLVTTSLNPGWSWGSGTLQRRRSDRLRGVVVEIICNKEVVYRQSRPEALLVKLDREREEREQRRQSYRQ